VLHKPQIETSHHFKCRIWTVDLVTHFKDRH